jgi:hypothetical protein
MFGRGQGLTSPRKKPAAEAGKEEQSGTSIASAGGLIIQFLFSRILTFYIPPTPSLPFFLSLSLSYASLSLIILLMKDLHFN